MVSGPFVEKLRYGPVKLLIRWPLRLGYVVVDLPEGHRLQYRLSGSPVPSLEEERPLRAGVEPMGAGKELCPRHARHPPLGEHDGHLLARRPEVPQHLHASLGRALAHNAVIAAVALAKLVLEPG